MGKKKFIIGGIIIFLAVGYLAYAGFNSSATYYYTISELAAQENYVAGDRVRINGQVAAGSIERDAGELVMRFVITEGDDELPVYYKGVVPDVFQEGIDVVIEGFLDADGVFQADSILTKCPSKYAPE